MIPVYTDKEVKPGTAYVYSVKAVNIAGYSEFSNKNVAATFQLLKQRG
jgi:hypothetical protein